METTYELLATLVLCHYFAKAFSSIHDLTKIVGTESNRHRQVVATKFSQPTGASAEII